MLYIQVETLRVVWGDNQFEVHGERRRIHEQQQSLQLTAATVLSLQQLSFKEVEPTQSVSGSYVDRLCKVSYEGKMTICRSPWLLCLHRCVLPPNLLCNHPLYLWRIHYVYTKKRSMSRLGSALQNQTISGRLIGSVVKATRHWSDGQGFNP